ncbi:hypothetical protein Poly41_03860 [Novipirellula artificiosorum]|uniref:Uncharacterized protein n=1 Tax=Novipirellula artificiosorum TaxID=2528016 RepID=A0A5C6DZQ0_9BACT|nr:hypothetical protein Poly41_03860 [Novipirellula artificiosorum]
MAQQNERDPIDDQSPLCRQTRIVMLTSPKKVCAEGVTAGVTPYTASGEVGRSSDYVMHVIDSAFSFPNPPQGREPEQWHERVNRWLAAVARNRFHDS